MAGAGLSAARPVTTTAGSPQLSKRIPQAGANRVGGRLIEQKLGDIRLIGYSLAGEETVIAAPELNVCFDVGKAPAEILAVDHVLLSHGHMDHAAGLAYYLSQRNFVGNSPGCVLAPEPLVGPIRDLLRVWARIEGHESPAKIVGLGPNDEFQVRRGLVVRTFAVNHGVPALGFCVIDVRRKLRPEFHDKSGPELVELKKKGVEIEYQVEVPLIAYCGDTADGAWIENEMVRTAKVLIVECTFFDADHVRRARAGRHLHVRDLARLLGRLDNEHIVISHVTRRTFVRDAKRVLAKLLDAEVLARTRFLMDGPRYRFRGARPPERDGRSA